jgi:GNAT superfamily N-acetyltransferase
MTELIEADETLRDTIQDGTYPIWNEGLTRQAYGAWNRGQMRTPWGRRHLQRVALVEAGRLLASAKRYLFDATLDGSRVSVLGIGAVFTPPELRGRGHARALIDLMIDDARGRGCHIALLFSEIGPSYYESLGFRSITRTLARIDVPRGGARRRPGAPATFVRSGSAADLRAIADLSARYASGASFALVRSAELIEFGFARRSLLAGLGPAGLRQTEFFVAEEGHQAVAYVFITRGPSGSVLEECGDRDPAGARIGAILQVLAERTPSEAVASLTGWLPAALSPPQLAIERGLPAPEIMMVRPIVPDMPIEDGGAPVVYWQTDLF